MNLIQKLVILCLLLQGGIAYALDGWKISIDDESYAYFPTDLKRGKIFMYLASGPYILNGAEMKGWFENQALKIQNKIGKPQNAWVVKPDKTNWSISNYFIEPKSGKQLSVGYQGGALEGDRAYIITMIASQDVSLMMKYGYQFNQVLADAKQRMLSITAPAKRQKSIPETASEKSSSPKNKRERIKKAIRVAPGKGLRLSDIDQVWVYSRIDLIWGGIDVDTYLLLKDGTAYKDCVIPPNELNIEKSKQLEPKKWSRWRKHFGTYQIKDNKKNDWIDLKGGPGGMVTDASKLVGKYINAGGSQFRGAWKKTIIFKQDQKFELSSFFMNDNSMLGGGDRAPGGDAQIPLVGVVGKSDKHGSSGSSSVIGDHIGGGGTSSKKDGSKNTGKFQVNNYTISMEHDNGLKHNELFLYEKLGDRKSIVYGNRIYYLD
jgi:hypothetical protein